jgi:hypothetical protein
LAAAFFSLAETGGLIVPFQMIGSKAWSGRKLISTSLPPSGIR